MKIILEPEESEKYFLDALCNLGYVCSSYDLTFLYNFDRYNKVKQPGDCYEDVLLRILKDGGRLGLKDAEDDERHYITLQDVHEWVQCMPFNHLANLINEEGDAETDDVLLQTVFFKEVIYG